MNRTLLLATLALGCLGAPHRAAAQASSGPQTAALGAPIGDLVCEESSAPPLTPEPEVVEDPPPRGMVIELTAMTAVIANGATLGVGGFLGESVLLRVHLSALHVWISDELVGIAAVSLGYVGSVGIADFEANLEAGVIGADLTRQDHYGGAFGVSGGVAVRPVDEVAVLAQLGIAAMEIGGEWYPAPRLTLGLRVQP
ncbi:MAG: hypothetical protein AB7S26_03580 [Sandaracinaceae bacterium]